MPEDNPLYRQQEVALVNVVAVNNNSKLNEINKLLK